MTLYKISTLILTVFYTIDAYQLFMLLYADDAVVFTKSPESLQSILNDLELYCATWGLHIYFENESNDF